MRRMGYLAAHSGFGAVEIEAMTSAQVDFWIGCLSLHFAWVREQES